MRKRDEAAAPPRGYRVPRRELRQAGSGHERRAGRGARRTDRDHRLGVHRGGHGQPGRRQPLRVAAPGPRPRASRHARGGLRLRRRCQRRRRPRRRARPATHGRPPGRAHRRVDRGRVVLHAAAERPADADAVVTLSAERTGRSGYPTLADARYLHTRALYVGTTEDGYTTFAAETRQLYRATRASGKQLLLLSGSEHGTDRHPRRSPGSARDLRDHAVRATPS
jgi:hypothetical protein